MAACRSTATNLTVAVTVSDALAVTGIFDLVTGVSTFDANGTPIAANEVLRTDGLPWANLGFSYGQTVYITGVGLRDDRRL